MTTITAAISSSYAMPVRSLEPTKTKETHSAAAALQELTEAAHRAIANAENSFTTVAPVAAGASAGLAAALWNLDSGVGKSSLPALETASADEPADHGSVESELLKVLAQALGVDEAV